MSDYCFPVAQIPAVRLPDVSDVELDLQWVDWDEALFRAQRPQDIENLLQQYPDFAQSYLHSSDYPADSVLANQYYQLITNPAIDTLHQQTRQVFGDLSSLKEDFAQAFRRVKYYYPDFTPPTIYSTFTGLGTMGDDLFVSDSMIVISLEFFTGPSANYRPQVYDYLLARYRPPVYCSQRHATAVQQVQRHRPGRPVAAGGDGLLR